VVSTPALAQNEPTPTSPFDFAISRQFLLDFLAQDTFLPTFKIKMHSRSNVHTLASDCEIHLGGDIVGATFGDPPAVVVEPPNLCKFLPGGSSPVTTSPAATWRTRFDTKILNKNCDVTGFPRIYTEHAVGGEAGSSNPNHVFEIHPATKIACPGDTALDFTKFLRSFTGLRHIKPASAHGCITGLRLWVRYHNTDGEDHYEFFQARPGGCGNFVIVEVGSLPREWIQKTTGGHTGIGRITANGDQRVTLKLYSIEGTPADDWFERLKNNVHKPDDPRLVHGILTYDYFQIMRVLQQGAATLGKNESWVEIAFPLALVVLGPTDTVPWNEQ
jgi:hypothetical protein